jgi:hypothetical protein
VVMGEWVVFIRFRVRVTLVRGGVLLTSNVSCPRQILAILLGRNGHWQSPRRKVFYNHCAVNLTLDTGAETSMIKSSIAKQIGATIRKAKQTALRADGVTPFNVIGEIYFDVSRNSHTYIPSLCPCCSALVVRAE